ncbi:putative late blight resistance protein homolog R1B-12 [Olea europaea var. sylvestris]|uniref:putative late blight resistance protein homolog R1B-12 n=1 Tax=Olea europaea var. sylvestris TaxID=158386 RepID=UPI000C1D49AA|nr:putative late blight resistance protein homolog R1B-12 [Olea europaea var. sylvestris]
MTTRLGSVARKASPPPQGPHHMRFLTEEESWSLFCANVFGKDRCPCELEPMGKKIVQNCLRLPLAIVVIAGLLSKATRTVHHWTNVGENLSSLIDSNGEQCSKILSLSYKNLPHHLKACFLYFGIFQKYSDINVSTLFKLWVAEGFKNSAENKTLEDMAEENLLDLVDRNLILVSERSSIGKIKMCMIHDLLHDLCVREVQREKFFHVTDWNLHSIPNGNSLRRLILPSVSVKSSTDWQLSVLNLGTDHPTEMAKLFNLQYLASSYVNNWRLPASVYKLRYLQTLILYDTTVPVSLTPEIWTMTRLRHLQLGKFILPDPPRAENSVIVLENLQTLSTLIKFRCTEEILERVPNLKKLGICLEDVQMGLEYFYLKNLVHLHRLESLKFLFLVSTPSFLENIIFPSSLKKLTLDGSCIRWEDLTTIGKLPSLVVLKLKNFAFYGRPEWEPNEGGFRQLKYLLLDKVRLLHWRADRDHFPVLERLVIKNCQTKKIKEEQLRKYGNEDLQILINKVRKKRDKAASDRRYERFVSKQRNNRTSPLCR